MFFLFNTEFLKQIEDRGITINGIEFSPQGNTVKIRLIVLIHGKDQFQIFTGEKDPSNPIASLDLLFQMALDKIIPGWRS